MANKVKYGLKNAYYALKTSGGYGSPVAMPGAVSIALAPKGDLYKFYADNIEYFRSAVNGGYEGDFELALVPESFRKDVLGEILDTNGVLIEKADASTSEFALGFEVEGDEKSSKFWFYGCTATRPETSAKTKEDSIEAQTETIAIDCAPGSNGLVRVRTTEAVSTSTSTSWFTAVYTPVTT